MYFLKLVLYMFKPFSTAKIQKMIFEIPIIPQTLNIYN